MAYFINFISEIYLVHFFPMFLFDNPENIRKLWGTISEHWEKNGQKNISKIIITNLDVGWEFLWL